MATLLEIQYCCIIDNELIILAQSGDGSACQEIRKRYQMRLYQTALAMLSSPEKASAAVEYTWLAAWRDLHEFKGQSLFLSWICRRLIAYIVNNFLQSGNDNSPDV